MSGSASARSAAPAANGPSLSNPERDQALRAALASQKSPASTQPTERLIKGGFVSSGAVAAAARAGTGKPLSNQGSGVIIQVREQRREGTLDRHTSSETLRGPSVSPKRTAGLPSTSSVTYLAKPFVEPGPRQGSPSHIAAAVAAARSTTPSEKKSELDRAQSRSPERKDESSIPATNALVKMFEARSSSGSKVEVRPITAAGPSVVLSPKPVRALSVRMNSGREHGKDAQVASLRRGPVPPPSRDQPRSDRTRLVVRTRSAESVGRKDVEPLLQTVSYRPSRSPGRRPSAGDAAVSVRSTAVPGFPSQSRQEVGSKSWQSQPQPPSQPGTPRPAPRQASSTRSITTQMLVPDEGTKAASMAKRSVHQAQHVRPQLNADSLADAIVASSLASSRAPSPHKAATLQPPLPPPPRKGHKALGVTALFSHHSDGQSSSPRQISPGKPTTLKTTLRSTPPDEEALTAVKSGGGKLRKLANMPPLDSIVMADRKLYEGVWAANRGILLTPATADVANRGQNSAQQTRNDDVHGFVVRDIWSRSGLDRELLAQIWELVDGGERGVAKQSPHGTLSRQEFVVGMWLIDQALLGRKLPPSVPDEVWASLRVGSGLQFRR